VRFMALAIFLTGDLLRECAFSSRTSAFDQERRFARLPCLLAILTPCDTIARTDNGGARTSRVELAASSHLSDLEVLHSPPTSADCDLRLPQIVGRKTQWNFFCWLWEPQCSASGGQDRLKRSLMNSGSHPEAVLGPGAVASCSTTARRSTSPFR